MTAKEIVKAADDKMKKTVEATKREFSALRTGRASTSLVEGIRVEHYGTEMVLKQLATINTPDPRTIAIQPWDPTAISSIEKSILKSELGITPMNDGKVIRLNVPALTDERKAELLKKCKQIAEDGKISIRTARRVANDEIDKLEKDKVISEDIKFTTLEEIQKIVDNHSKEVADLLEAKEKEINQG